MTQDELQKAILSKNVNVIDPPQPTQTAQPSNSPQIDINEFITVLFALRAFRTHLTTAPTFIPKTFAEQIQLFDDGANRRVYLYVNGTWRYAALT